jgi:alkylated DNA repair dioxygenase AlkB
MQLSLLDRSDREVPEVDAGMSDRRRIVLDSTEDGTAWVDFVPGWVRGHNQVFETLRDSTRWQADRRRMYERWVDVPRRTATLPEDGPGHPLVFAMANILAARYGRALPSITVALYRDGRDSVAWHRDKGLRDQPESLMAIVSLGQPRRFLLRPLGGGASRCLTLGWGDLLVMGGTIQRTWEHSVPKVRATDPRMSIMFRGRYLA